MWNRNPNWEKDGLLILLENTVKNKECCRAACLKIVEISSTKQKKFQIFQICSRMNFFTAICLAFLLSLSCIQCKDQCVMRGQCAVDDLTDQRVPCVYNGDPVPIQDQTSINFLKTVCPSMQLDSDYSACCDSDQIQDLKNSLDILGSLFKRCPSCFHNLANLFCHFTCSPVQSQFLKVTNFTDDGKNKSVAELNYYITQSFAEGMFNSCSNVKLSSTASKAIDLACGGTSDCTPEKWLKYMGSHDPSPFQMNFFIEDCDVIDVNGKIIHPMNDTIIPCSQPTATGGVACSSVDCPSNLDDERKYQCVMRGTCAVYDVTDLSMPCVYNGNPVPLQNQTSINFLKTVCPSLKLDSDYSVCCDSDQIHNLENSLDTLAALFKRCPSCYHNLANLFCQLTCSPVQSKFLKVTNFTDNGESKSVTELSYYIAQSFAEGMFNSCSNVKLSSTAYKAIDLACGGTSDCTPEKWLKFMGGHDPSPFQMNFFFEHCDVVEVDGKIFYPMNDTIIPCSQPTAPGGVACSRVDCPSNPGDIIEFPTE